MDGRAGDRCPVATTLEVRRGPTHRSRPGQWGDAGYQGVDKRPENRGCGVAWQVAMKPGKRRLLDRDGAEAAAEKRKASVRAKVEHPFLYVKRRFLGGIPGHEPTDGRHVAHRCWPSSGRIQARAQTPRAP